MVTSERTSNPILLVQKSRASSWSRTHSWVVESLIMPCTLIARRLAVFSKRAVLRAGVGPHDAGGDDGPGGGGRERGAVLGRRLAEHATEARREGADAGEPDRQADLRDGVVGRAQQGGRALEPAGEQVRVRRLAEGAPELAREVRAREARGRRHVVDVKRFGVPRVGEVLGFEQMPGGG